MICKNIVNMKYTRTPFGGHKILSFTKKRQNEKGRGYYKMNTSILKDLKYRKLVEETIQEMGGAQTRNEIEFWDIFLQTIKAKTITYSQIKNKIKRDLKRNILKKIDEIENRTHTLDEEMDRERYNFFKQKIKEIEINEIEGYKTRVKYLSKYEKAEPDIAFYSKMEEKKIAADSISQLAEHKNGKIYTDNENIMRISTKYYTELYTPGKVNTTTQDKLLRNIKNKITTEQKHKLDAPISIDEVKKTIFQMQPGKSPGLHSIPIEFYQEF